MKFLNYLHKILCKLVFSDVCSKQDQQNWSTILLPCTFSPLSLFFLQYFFTLHSPLVSQVPSLQSQPSLLQAALPSLGEGHRPPELAGISFHPTLIQKGCCPLWYHSGSRTAVGHRLQCPGWEKTRPDNGCTSKHCRVEGEGGRSREEQVELRFEKRYVRLTKHLLFINVHVFTVSTREKDSMSYSPCKVPCL